MYLGDTYMGQGKPADAVTWYRRALSKSGNDLIAKTASVNGLAAALEDRGDFAQAAASYEELAKLGTTDNQRARAMLAEARCLAKAGQSQKAIALYTQVQRLPVVDIEYYNAAGFGLGELSTGTATP
jgi:tetratricopeptide (TPR) repeat protein